MGIRGNGAEGLRGKGGRAKRGNGPNCAACKVLNCCLLLAILLKLAAENLGA